MTTPTLVRLPDPFTPDRTTANAATPTCSCCCCCSCAISVVGTAVALPAGLAFDLREADQQPHRKERSRSSWRRQVALVAIVLVPFALVAVPAMPLFQNSLFSGSLISSLMLWSVLAVPTVMAIAAMAGTRNFAISGLRLVVGVMAMAAEFCLSFVAVIATGGIWLVLSLGVATFVGAWVATHYLKKPVSRPRP